MSDESEINDGSRQDRILYQSDLRSTPLGRLRLAGLIVNGRGVAPVRPLRVYGSYAVMCVRRGAGIYRDAAGFTCDLKAGDAVLVFPELAHWYGPRRGQGGWDEFYITFEGPVFDMWRESGLLSSSRPVLHLGLAAMTPWIERVRAILEQQPVGERGRARQVADFVGALDALLGDTQEETESTPLPAGRSEAPGEWLALACARLELDLQQDISYATVAAELNLSSETFRKRFQEATGTTPARYRMARRIAAAQALLSYTPGITNREVAETLGFADEFHFSRRFTQITGFSPRDFRKR